YSIPGAYMQMPVIVAVNGSPAGPIVIAVPISSASTVRMFNASLFCQLRNSAVLRIDWTAFCMFSDAHWPFECLFMLAQKSRSVQFDARACSHLAPSAQSSH